MLQRLKVHTGIKTVCWFFNYEHKCKAPQISKEKSFHEVLKIQESCRTQSLDVTDRQSPTSAIVFTMSVQMNRQTTIVQLCFAIGHPQRDIWQLHRQTDGPILFPVFVPCTSVNHKLPTILLASYTSFHTIFMFQSNQSAILPSIDGSIPISSIRCQILFFRSQCQRFPFSQYQSRNVLSSLIPGNKVRNKTE